MNKAKAAVPVTGYRGQAVLEPDRSRLPSGRLSAPICCRSIASEADHGHENPPRQPVKKTKPPESRSKAPPKPIELYYWPTPNGHKISIMLEELGLPYEVQPVNIGKGEQFAPAFLKISPNNRMPAIVDPDGPGRQADLGLRVRGDPAISRPQDRQASIRRTSAAGSQVEEWLFWQVGGLGPMAGQANHFLQLCHRKTCPIAKKRYTDEVHRLFGVMNKRLATRKYLGRAPIPSPTSPAGAGCCRRSKYPAAGRISHISRPGATGWARARPSSAARRWAAELRKPMTDDRRRSVRTRRVDLPSAHAARCT